VCTALPYRASTITTQCDFVKGDLKHLFIPSLALFIYTSIHDHLM